MLERREFARRHRSSSLFLSLPSSCCKLLLELRIARYRLHVFTHVYTRVRSCLRARARLLTYRKETPTYVATRTHARTHAYARALARPAPLILLEATDAPISVRVSFVIRENVNQSPGSCRLLLLRLLSFFILPATRECVPACACARGHVELPALSRPYTGTITSALYMCLAS